MVDALERVGGVHPGPSEKQQRACSKRLQQARLAFEPLVEAVEGWGCGVDLRQVGLQEELGDGVEDRVGIRLAPYPHQQPSRRCVAQRLERMLQLCDVRGGAVQRLVQHDGAGEEVEEPGVWAWGLAVADVLVQVDRVGKRLVVGDARPGWCLPSAHRDHAVQASESDHLVLKVERARDQQDALGGESSVVRALAMQLQHRVEHRQRDPQPCFEVLLVRGVQADVGIVGRTFAGEW